MADDFRTTEVGDRYAQALFDLALEGAITEEEAVKNADSANNVRLKLKLYKDNPTAPQAAAPASAPVAVPKAAPANWAMELKLEEIEEDTPPEDPGRPSF